MFVSSLSQSTGKYIHLYFEQALTQVDQVSRGQTVAIQGNVLVEKNKRKKTNCFLMWSFFKLQYLKT